MTGGIVQRNLRKCEGTDLTNAGEVNWLIVQRLLAGLRLSKLSCTAFPGISWWARATTHCALRSLRQITLLTTADGRRPNRAILEMMSAS